MQALKKLFALLAATVVTVCLCSCTPDDTEKTGFTVAPELTETLSPEPSLTPYVVACFTMTPAVKSSPTSTSKKPVAPAFTPSLTPAPPLEPNIPSDAKGDYHPVGIIWSYDKPGIMLMGGSKDGQFYNYEEFLLDGLDMRTNSEVLNAYYGKTVNCALARGNEQYTLYSRTQLLEKTTGKKPLYYYWEGNGLQQLVIPCGISHEVETVLAICGNWNALPRIPEYTDDGFTVDIEGNGTVEKLWITNNDDPKDNRYTITEVHIRMDGNDILMVSASWWNYSSSGKQNYSRQYDCSAFDIDGDNTLEILITGGSSYHIYSIKDAKAIPVMGFYNDEP